MEPSPPSTANGGEQDPEEGFADEAPPSSSAATGREVPTANAGAGRRDEESSGTAAETTAPRQSRGPWRCSSGCQSRCTECAIVVAATVPVASWFLLAVSCISLIFAFFFSAMSDAWLSDMLTLTSAFTFVLSMLSFAVSICARRRLGYFY